MNKEQYQNEIYEIWDLHHRETKRIFDPSNDIDFIRCIATSLKVLTDLMLSKELYHLHQKKNGKEQ